MRLRLPLQISKERTFIFKGRFHPLDGSLKRVAHMEFFPKAAAGWTRTRYPYWATEESLRNWQLAKTSFFLPDLRTFPFAYPEFSEEDELGQQTVSYPSRYTDGLFPHLELHTRIREVQANLENVVVPPPVANKRKGDQQHATRERTNRRKTRKL